MRVSCACNVGTVSDSLLVEIEELGLTPTITSQVIRVVHEGDKAIGEAIIELFQREIDHEITAYYDKGEIEKAERRAARKAKRAKANAKLHGH